MNYDDLNINVIPPPYKNWCKHLRPGNLIWLTKLQKIGIVTNSYPISKIRTSVRMWIPFINQEQVWHVKDWGKGFDGSQIIEPIQGHFEKEDSCIISSNNESMHNHICYDGYGGVSFNFPGTLEGPSIITEVVTI